MIYHNLTFIRDDGEKLTMSKDTDIRVIDITGIEASSYTINTTSSEEDGADIANVKIEPREIEITGDIKKNDKEDTNRQTLISFFDPKQSGTIYIARNEITRKINYKVSGNSFDTNKLALFINFTLSLLCVEDPYFSDASSVANSITEITPQFTFPLTIVYPAWSTRSKIMGYKQYKNVMNIVNDGDKETGIEIIVKAQRGTMSNITITLNNDEYIKVYVNMIQGDVLEINTNARQKYVHLNGINIINQIDKDSTFFQLKKGKNIFGYECESGRTNIDIQTNFYRRFLGV